MLLVFLLLFFVIFHIPRNILKGCTVFIKDWLEWPSLGFKILPSYMVKVHCKEYFHIFPDSQDEDRNVQTFFIKGKFDCVVPRWSVSVDEVHARCHVPNKQECHLIYKYQLLRTLVKHVLILINK